jgi:DNA repair protein RadD
MKVTYYCGLRSFNEYVCIQHDGFAQRKARQWWRERSSAAFPDSTADALVLADTLSAATHLRIWINKQYPEILAHCFDGTAFGQREAGALPTTDTAASRVPTSEAPDFDDIPF